jgi:hypothetical protein
MNPKMEYLSLNDIIENEVINEEDVNKTLKMPLSHYKKCMDFFLKTFEETVYQYDNPKNSSCTNTKFAIITIMFRMVGTLQCIRNLDVKGYHFESSVLSRNFYESLGLCVFLKEHPEKTEKWLNGEIVVTSKEAFKQFIKIFLTETNEGITNQTVDTYKMLCDFVHGKAIVNIFTIVNAKNKKYSFQIPPRFRKMEVSGLWLFSITMLYGLLYLFKDDLKNEQQTKIGEYILKEFGKYYKYRLKLEALS